MHFKILIVTVVATIVRSVSALPLAQAENSGLILWNGNENVVTSLDTTGFTSRSINMTTDPGLVRRDDIDCSGQPLCNKLGGVDGDCADAERIIISTNIYQTGANAGSTGVCKGKCGIFVKGDHCQASGTQLIDAYNSIRQHGCSDCGVFTRASDSCQLKIDKVSFC